MSVLSVGRPRKRWAMLGMAILGTCGLLLIPANPRSASASDVSVSKGSTSAPDIFCSNCYGKNAWFGAT